MQGIDATPNTSTTPAKIRDVIKAVYDSETAPNMDDGKLAYVLDTGVGAGDDGHAFFDPEVHNETIPIGHLTFHPCSYGQKKAPVG